MRTHHPDRGGDTDAFADGLRQFDALLHAGEPDHRAAAALTEHLRPVTVLRRPRGINGWARHLSRQLTSAAHQPQRPPRVH